MSFTLKVHDYKRRRDGNQAVLVRVQPYVRLKNGEESPPIFVQSGKFWAEGGDEIDEDDLPDWVAGEIAKMSKTAKREAGLEVE
jgi:hypothetical protein